LVNEIILTFQNFAFRTEQLQQGFRSQDFGVERFVCYRRNWILTWLRNFISFSVK